MKEQQDRPETYRRRNARFGSSARSSWSFVAASGVISIVVALPSMAIERILPVLLELWNPREDRGKTREYDGGRSGNGDRRAKEDGGAAEQRSVQHTHPLRAERVRAHDPAAYVVRRGELDLGVGERLREHRGAADDDQQDEGQRVIVGEGEDEDGEHLGHRGGDDEAAAVTAVTRVREVERGHDGTDAAADEQERVPQVVDVQYVVSEEHQERVERVAEKDHAEHLDANERGDERTSTHEAQAVAEGGTDRRHRAGAERLHAHERQEDEDRDERERNPVREHHHPEPKCRRRPGQLVDEHVADHVLHAVARRAHPAEYPIPPERRDAQSFETNRARRDTAGAGLDL